VGGVLEPHRPPSTPITQVKAQADFWNPTGNLMAQDEQLDIL
jgi:hypothetical protein